MIMTAPVLERPHPEGSALILQTDASVVGYGAVLLQEIDGVVRMLEYASQTLQSAERNYTVTERECLAVFWAVGKFHPCIEGYNFKVVTDHSSLRWLCSMKNQTSRLVRWALEIQAHHFVVEHRKGALNYVADAISRMYEEDEPVVTSVTWSHTTDDPWYLEWVDKVTLTPEDYPTWKIVAGNLYVYRPDAEVSEVLGGDDALKVVVPQEHRQAVLRECHDKAVAGHLGGEKTFARVAQHYYWPRYYSEVGDYVRSCHVY